MRRLIAIPCASETLVATLDDAAGRTGLLIVSGGNEIRCGAHRGMAMLAQALAGRGVPVLRYDRRGIGDSTGLNAGFEGSTDDMAAAVAALRANGVTRVVGFGNCDAASALALFHADTGIDALVLSNPWIGGSDDALPQAAAIRARYAERLRSPREWLRLLRGGVNLRKLAGGLAKAVRSEDTGLLSRMAASLRASGVPVTILLAVRDNTAVAFADAWATLPGRPDVRQEARDSASHSYAGEGDFTWLLEQVLRATHAPAQAVAQSRSRTTP
ncbi:alpha/beta hydrolase [Sphingomonas sp. Leaf33]|nr:alpha/beta hydrolase [Sphingomonas sp. Leaf33]